MLYGIRLMISHLQAEELTKLVAKSRPSLRVWESEELMVQLSDQELGTSGSKKEDEWSPFKWSPFKFKKASNSFLPFCSIWALSRVHGVYPGWQGQSHLTDLNASPIRKRPPGHTQKHLTTPLGIF